MFEAYKKEVLDFYQQKKAASGLSMNLQYPTRAKLRDECINVIRSRYLKKDSKTIEATFGDMEDITTYLMRIKKSGAEKLKTLDNFLKDNQIGTDIKNIELLAWLIDFEPRPYRSEQHYGPPLTKAPEDALPVPEEQQVRRGQDESDPASCNNDLSYKISPAVTENKRRKPKQRPANQILILYFIAIVAVFLITSILFHKSKTPNNAYMTISGAEKCMVWAGDHYKPVSCTSTFNDRQVIALDTVRLKGFKKIMRNDTVTKNSINKLWYFKAGGHLELYTAQGFHPIHTDRKLRRLSDHMWHNYIKQN